MCMSDLERIEDQHPELTFWGIEVENPRYHGHVEGNDVYINLLQPNLDWLKTALHETVHYEYDYSNLSNQELRKTMIAEGWARRESERRYKELFGKN